MNLFQRFNGGIAGVLQGPPKTGKSFCLGTAAELGKAQLVCLKAREVNSYGYVKTGINKEAVIFDDPMWQPDLDDYTATGYIEFLKYMRTLYRRDDVDVVLIDPLTDLNELAEHEILKRSKSYSPRDFGGMEFYGELKRKLDNAMRAILALCHAPHPKHVFAAIHTQPVKDTDLKNKTHKDMVAKGVLYEGDVLPSWEGAAKYLFAADWDFSLYTKLNRSPPKKAGQAPTVAFEVQVRPNKQRHSGIALSPMFAETYYPNSIPAILEAVEKSFA